MSKILKNIAQNLQPDMRCNCDLDKWEPEPSTGHSQVCRIHGKTLWVAGLIQNEIRRIAALEAANAKLGTQLRRQGSMPNPLNAAEFIDDDGNRFAWSESNVCYESAPKDGGSFQVLRMRLARAEQREKGLLKAFSPVLDWYNGDGERTDLALMIADAVADLQSDRKQVLGLPAIKREAAAMGIQMAVDAHDWELQDQPVSPDDLMQVAARIRAGEVEVVGR